MSTENLNGKCGYNECLAVSDCPLVTDLLKLKKSRDYIFYPQRVESARKYLYNKALEKGCKRAPELSTPLVRI